MGTGKSYEVQKKKKDWTKFMLFLLCISIQTQSLHDSNFKYVAE